MIRTAWRRKQMKFYKEKGISPFASCLPTLIQFPIIIGLYQSIIQTMGNAPLQMLNLVSKLSPLDDQNVFSHTGHERTRCANSIE